MRKSEMSEDFGQDRRIVLSGTSIERVNRSKISELITTDTIPLPAEKQNDKITVISTAPLVTAAIRSWDIGAVGIFKDSGRRSI